MKLKPIYIVITAVVLLLLSSSRVEALNCSIVSPGFSTGFSGTVNNVTQSSFTATCTRTGGDPNPYTFNYSVTVGNGCCVNGGSNRARLGATANYIFYDTYKNSSCTTKWGGGGGAQLPVPSPGSMTLNGFTPTSVIINYYGCITVAGQNPPAGTYTDTLTMTLSIPGPNRTGTFPVSITSQAICTLTTAPGNVAFAYTSFQVAAATANTTIGVNCSNLLPYTVALDAYSGTIPGVNLAYTLNVTDSLAATVLSTTSLRGSGGVQTYTITGTMASGQSGTCALATCPGTQPRTLTITY